jgi:predicted transcriptional regulator
MQSATSMPAVVEFMTQTVHTVSPEAEVTSAVSVLTRHSCSGVPVVDAAGRIVGVLTHAGCMRALSGAVFNGEEAGHVDDAMARDFVIIEPSADKLGLADRSDTPGWEACWARTTGSRRAARPSRRSRRRCPRW